MNVHVLIDSIVRQTTVLIAQLATAGGARAPLSHVAGQVFLSLARELENQGVSRKVSADMFGMALRTYQRRTQRSRESATDRGRSLWEAVFAYVQDAGVVPRESILRRFHRDDEALVRGVLHDLCETNLLFATGSGTRTAYRAATEAELGSLRASGAQEGLESLLWAMIYREGPLTDATLHERVAADPGELEAALQCLVRSGRVQLRRQAEGVSYSAREIVLGFSTVGWEGAVLDHFQALVKTICAKLALEASANANDRIGGSTYTFDVWPGHPEYEAVVEHLTSFRRAQSELRRRVDATNARLGLPDTFQKVVVYGGQYIVDFDATLAEESSDEDA